MLCNKTVLVTGGTGFLGRHLQDAFKPYQNNNKIVFLGSSDGDLTIYDSVKKIFREYKPDAIVHAAALCGGIKANSKSPADFMRVNLEMAINIFEAAKFENIKRIYTLGSCCAYPKFCPVPFKEDDIWNGFPEETNAPYGIAKRGMLLMSQAYRQQYGMGGAHLILANLYGPYDNFDLEDSHVIPALINKFTTAVEKNLDVVKCWGTGAATREFLYAGDAAEAIVSAAILDLDTGLPINLGVGTDISIKNLALMIAELTGFKGKIEFTGEVSDGQPKRCLDTSRAKDILGWQARTELPDGLRKTIEWYNRIIK